MEEDVKEITAGDLINESLFWLEGILDDTCKTREDALALMARAISSLQSAYTSLMFN